MILVRHPPTVDGQTVAPVGMDDPQYMYKYGCGSKNRYQNGTLVSGNMHQNLRNPSCSILSHSHIDVSLVCTTYQLETAGICPSVSIGVLVHWWQVGCSHPSGEMQRSKPEASRKMFEQSCLGCWRFCFAQLFLGFEGNQRGWLNHSGVMSCGRAPNLRHIRGIWAPPGNGPHRRPAQIARFVHARCSAFINQVFEDPHSLVHFARMLGL